MRIFNISGHKLFGLWILIVAYFGIYTVFNFHFFFAGSPVWVDTYVEAAQIFIVLIPILLIYSILWLIAWWWTDRKKNED